ncbi:MAG: anti-sigma factor [Acidimicrobiia bacterium]|nr:anti-sigma factor [Acidimicrobiia bacterium]
MSEEHDLVAAYALNALDELEAHRFERHLDECDSCRRELAELLEATTFLADLSSAAAPTDLRQRVLSQIQAPGRRRGLAWIVATAAAAVALVFGSLWATSLARLDHFEQVAAIYQAADAQPTALAGAEGEGRFTHSVSLGQGVFATEDLADAPADSVYELWLIDDTGPHPAGLFEAGEAVIVDDFSPGQMIAVTLEPAGGSDLPTGPILLSGQL